MNTRRSRNSSTERTSWEDRLVFLLVGALLFLAPLVRGGNREAALSLLLGLALAALACWAAQASSGHLWPLVPGQRTAGAKSRPRWWWLALGFVLLSPAWLALWQLAPWPETWWAAAAGRQPYRDALQTAGIGAGGAWPLSLHPDATKASLWAGVPVVAALVAGLTMRRTHVDKLLLVLLVAGMVQVLVAVAQFAGGPRSALYFGIAGQGFIGTFANRNHLADFLAMLVPVWFYLWLRLQREGDGWDGGRWMQAMRRPGLLFAGFSLLVVILSSQSRGGILASAVVLMLCMGVYLGSSWRRLRRWQRAALVGLFIAFVAVAVSVIDLRGVLQRVEHGRLQTDAEVRNTLALATWDAARALWPWGSGLGTFESVFPRFQPAVSPAYVNHAHNDYAQILMEMGAAGLVLVAAVLALAAWQALCLWRAQRKAGGRMPAAVALSCFAGLGVLALLLHSWVEFNMHIPALAITAGFLMGVFLRTAEKD